MNVSITAIKEFLFGKPLSTEALDEVRLPKLKALPLLSSDALSSVAYGTEEILRVLVLGGIAAMTFSLPVAIAICGLIAILGASYWQTIEAYPNGGGAFTVARENLGQTASLLAGAALLIDYLMTVAVSITAGVLAVTSAFPALIPHTIGLCVLTIIFIAAINLRGIRESGSIFAIPTYAFVIAVILLIGVIIWKLVTHTVQPTPFPTNIVPLGHELHAISILLILSAFSQGCSALTGIECIANGVPVFEKPEVKNAQKTLIMMVVLLGGMFFGISYFASYLHLLPNDQESLLSILGHAGFGNGFLYYFLQVATALILLLAANTAFTGFPRLASILAQHNYLPKQLSSLGDRLSFSNGIIVLAGLSCLLVILFHGNTNALIPLYSIGVFLAFSMSQLGMVRCWHRLKTKHWHIKAFINLLGFITTMIALLIIVDTKFVEGAWIVVILVPLFFYMFLKINRHYQDVDRELSVTNEQAVHYFRKMEDIKPKVILPISKIHRGTLAAINFARSVSDDVTAVVVDLNPEATATLRNLWHSLDLKVNLVVLDSPYRSAMAPLREFIKMQDRRDPERGLCMIVLPKAITTKWWHPLLHNHRAALFKASLYYNKEKKGSTRIFVDVPYQLKR